MIRKLTIFFFLMLAVTIRGTAAGQAPIKIITQNMDAGTDLTFAVAELRGILPVLRNKSVHRETLTAT